MVFKGTRKFTLRHSHAEMEKHPARTKGGGAYYTTPNLSKNVPSNIGGRMYVKTKQNPGLARAKKAEGKKEVRNEILHSECIIA